MVETSGGTEMRYAPKPATATPSQMSGAFSPTHVSRMVEWHNAGVRRAREQTAKCPFKDTAIIEYQTHTKHESISDILYIAL
jgi:hypothetical protein